MSGGVLRPLAPAAFAISASCGRQLLAKTPACLALGLPITGQREAVSQNPLDFRWAGTCQRHRASVTPGSGCYHERSF